MCTDLTCGLQVYVSDCGLGQINTKRCKINWQPTQLITLISCYCACFYKVVLKIPSSFCVTLTAWRSLRTNHALKPPVYKAPTVKKTHAIIVFNRNMHM